MTDLNSEACELSEADLDAVVAGSLNAYASIGPGVGSNQAHNIGSQSKGAGAGKVVFDPF
jgi:hypothetical protein